MTTINPIKETASETLNRLLYTTDCTVLIMFSGGKDSFSTFYELHFNKGIALDRFVFMHHNIDGASDEASVWDYPVTEDYCRKVAQAFGVPILFNWRNGGIQREVYRTNEGLQNISFQRYEGGRFEEIVSKPGSSTRRKFPAASKSLSSRWCSAVAKIDVSHGVIRRIWAEDEELIVVTGERAEEDRSKEGTGRASYAEVEFSKTHSEKKRRTVVHYRPILQKSEVEIWAEYRSLKLQAHPAYELGRGRTSCRTCIFCGRNAWATMLENNPAVIDTFEKTEKDLAFTLKKSGKKPVGIREFAQTGTSARGTIVDPETFDKWNAVSESETFDEPIFVENWKQPAGAFNAESCGSL